MKIRTTAMGVVLGTLSLALLATPAIQAQTHPVPARVTAQVDDTRTVQLKGNVHPLARAEFDRGAVADSQPMTKMHLLLQRSAEQEAALQQLLEEQQTKGLANYHAWLAPGDFGKRFGPSDGDIQTVTDWLTRQGFRVSKVAAGRTVIEFSGTVAQVRNAFHTEIHNFTVNSEEHFANVGDPAIPQALSPVVAGVVSLHNFRKKPFIHRVGKFRRDLITGEIKPLFTFNDVNGTFYAVGPADFATIYGIPQGADGSGQSIAIVGRSNINLQDVRDFRSMFGLAAKDPTILLNGPDPGLVSGDEGESDLDVEWAGAVAPAAQIIFVPTLGTLTDGVDGVDASALYIVDNNVAPVLSDSYGSCELGLGTTGNNFYNALWQQAAAEGITVVVAAGDNGPAGCDNPNSQTKAVGGIAISGLASTPYNIAMGGTDFNQVGNQSTYWNSNGTTNVYPSAKGYIPEIPWNDSCAGQSNNTSACSSATVATGLNIAAGSGGPSGVYSKPIWQTGTGVPADGARDIPDVSLFASDGGFEGNSKSFYAICESDQDIPGDTGCNLTSRSSAAPFHDFQAVGGTSAATPTFAGIMALVNQKTGQRQGNANFVLYRLATSSPTVFHDVTTGNISVPCTGGTPNCSATSSSSVGAITTTSGGSTVAYTAGAGYDMATGLGSVNVSNLLLNWSNATSTHSTATTLSNLAPASLSVDSSVSVSGSVTSLAGTPTGLVNLVNVTTNAAIDVFTLTNGTFSGSTAFLPGGSYSVKVHYGGDGTGTFGPSDSTPLAVNVTKQNSTVQVGWVAFDSANNPILPPNTSSKSVPYGSAYILRVDVKNGSGSTCQNLSTGAISFICPTGTITLTKNSGSPLNDFPTTNGGSANVANLNDRGFIEDQPIQLPAGSYSIAASYSGDTSYNAQATSNTLSVTISPAATTTLVASSISVLPAGGGSVTLAAAVGSNSNSAQGPTGTIQFQNGSTNIGAPVTCTPSGATANAGASCTATLPNVAISALFPPPTNDPRPTLPLLPVLFALLSIVFFALGGRWMPEKRRRTYAYAGFLAFALLAVAIAGCGGGGGSGKTVTIKASYVGDTNYAASSGTTKITVQ
jgi:hypothetical protein